MNISVSAEDLLAAMLAAMLAVLEHTERTVDAILAGGAK